MKESENIFGENENNINENNNPKVDNINADALNHLEIDDDLEENNINNIEDDFNNNNDNNENESIIEENNNIINENNIINDNNDNNINDIQEQIDRSNTDHVSPEVKKPVRDYLHDKEYEEYDKKINSDIVDDYVDPFDNEGDDIFNEHINDKDIPYVDPRYREPKQKRNWAFIPQVEEPAEEEVKYVAPEVDPKDLTERINAAKERKQKQHFAEHLKKKAEYDEAMKFLDEIERMNAGMRHAYERMAQVEKEMAPGKDRDDIIDTFKEDYNRIVKARSQMDLDNRKFKKAGDVRDDYQAEEKALNDSLPGVLADAEKSVRDAYAAEKLAVLKNEALEKKFAEERRLKRVSQREKDDKRTVRTEVRKYTGLAKTRYNEDLKYAVDSVKESPKEDIYRIATFQKMDGEGFDVTKLTSEDLHDAEQVYDRMFMDLKAHYDTHNFARMDDSSPENFMTVSGITVNGKKIENEPLSHVIYDLYSEKGIDADNPNVVESHHFNQMVKAFVLYTMAYQKGNIEYKPKFFNKSGKLEIAETNDTDYTINTKGIQGLVADPSQLKTEKYNRLSYNQMKALEPVIEEPIFEDPNPYVEKDPEFLKNLHSINNLKDKIGRGDAQEFKFDLENDDFKPVDEIKIENDAKLKEEIERRDVDNNGRPYTVISYLEEEKKAAQERMDEKEANEEGMSLVGRIADDRMELPPKENENADNFTEINLDFEDDSVINNVNNGPENNVPQNKKPAIDLNSQKFKNEVAIKASSDFISYSALNSTIVQMFGWDSNFPEFKDEFETLRKSYEDDMNTISHKFIETHKLANKNLDQRVSDPAAMQKLARTAVILDNVLTNLYMHAANKAISEGRTIEKDPNCRIIDAFRTNLEIMNHPNYSEILMADPDYPDIFDATFGNFPYNSFKKNDGKFGPDYDRYVKMMDRIPFIDQIEERQKFIKSEIINYERLKKEGRLDQQIMENHNKAYHKHLKDQVDYSEKIKALKYKGEGADKDITELEVFSKNPKQMFGENWQGGRMAKTAVRRGNEAHEILDRGWAVEDIGFVSEMSVVKSSLENAIDNNAFSKEMQKKAQEILNSLEKPMERMNKSFITSTEVRDDILESFRKPIEEYLKWDKQKPLDNLKNDAIRDIYNEAVNRKVEPAEVGNRYLRVDTDTVIVGNPEYDLVSNPNVPSEIKVTYKVPAGISFDQIEDNVKMMVDDLHAVEVWYHGSDAFSEMKEYMEDLQKYTQNNMRNIQATNVGQGYQDKYLEGMKLLKAKLISTRKKTKAYLDKKQVDFDEKHDRRDDRGKQSVEQSRINMAINNYDKLSFMIDKIQDFEDYLRPENVYAREQVSVKKAEAKRKINEYLRAEEPKLQNPKDRNEYALAVGRVIMYNIQLKDGYYMKSTRESLDAYKARMEKVGNELTKDDIQAYIHKDPALSKIIKREYDSYNVKDNAVNIRYTEIELFADYLKEAKSLFSVYTRNTKAESREAVNGFKDRLVSNQKKQARQQKEQQKTNARQQREQKKEGPRP